MKKRILIGFMALLILSCNEKSNTGFSLNGITHGIENGTILYLQNTLTNELIDSISVIDNSFYLQTNLRNTPLEIILSTKDNSQYRSLWIENNSMTFDATKSDFRNAIVTGSETEELSQAFYRFIDTLSREEKRFKEKEFVNDNPNSIVSASILSFYSTTWGKEKTKELFDKFSENNKNSEYGKQVARYIELNKDPKVGEPFIDFEMEDQNGELKRLSEIKGNAVLIEFWASNCGPCRSENPRLVNTYHRYNSKGFEIFAVSLDEDKESWIKAIEEDSLHWSHVCDLKGDRNTASLIYGISGIPDNFLIDENGVIVGRNLRGEQLTQKLREILE